MISSSPAGSSSRACGSSSTSERCVAVGRRFAPDERRLACRFLREESSSTLVVDPFCGHGTALAVANHYGFNALGTELSTRKVKAAKRLSLDLLP